MAKYYLDTDLIFKRIKLTFKQRFIRFIIGFIISFIIGVSFNLFYYHFFGSYKEKHLEKMLENTKLEHHILNKQLNSINERLKHLNISESLYRDILELGFIEYEPYNVNIEHYKNFEIFNNYDIIIPLYKKLDTLSYLTYKHEASFYILNQETHIWKHRIEHLPYITPVSVTIKRGEGVGFREVHPVLGYPTWHHGQDFRAPLGTPVYTTGAGKVIYVGYDKGFGNFIKIDHEYGYQTIYGHLSEFKVKQGQEVKRGDLIALTGNTGYSTGPHLHYEIHLYGKYQNPLHFFSDNMDEDEYLEMINTLNSIFRK